MGHVVHSSHSACKFGLSVSAYSQIAYGRFGLPGGFLSGGGRPGLKYGISRKIREIWQSYSYGTGRDGCTEAEGERRDSCSDDGDDVGCSESSIDDVSPFIACTHGPDRRISKYIVSLPLFLSFYRNLGCRVAR